MSRISALRHYRIILVLLLLSLLMALVGCGYHNPYTTDHPEDRGQAARLYNSIWPNRTSEAGLESLFFRTINGWFKKTSRVSLTSDPDQADLLLEGEIVGIDLPALSYAKHEEVAEARIIIILNCSLRRADDRTLLWEEKRLALDDAYSINSSAEITRANQRLALIRIAEDLAERIYLRTLAVKGESGGSEQQAPGGQ